MAIQIPSAAGFIPNESVLDAIGKIMQMFGSEAKNQRKATLDLTNAQSGQMGANTGETLERTKTIMPTLANDTTRANAAMMGATSDSTRAGNDTTRAANDTKRVENESFTANVLGPLQLGNDTTRANAAAAGAGADLTRAGNDTYRATVTEPWREAATGERFYTEVEAQRQAQQRTIDEARAARASRELQEAKEFTARMMSADADRAERRESNTGQLMMEDKRLQQQGNQLNFGNSQHRDALKLQRFEMLRQVEASPIPDNVKQNMRYQLLRDMDPEAAADILRDLDGVRAARDRAARNRPGTMPVLDLGE